MSRSGDHVVVTGSKRSVTVIAMEISMTDSGVEHHVLKRSVLLEKWTVVHIPWVIKRIMVMKVYAKHGEISMLLFNNLLHF